MSGVDPSLLRVMIVDDHGTMRKIVRRLLKQVGIADIIEAANGEEALTLLRDPRITDPDVIVSDLHMDGIDGLQMCNIIRRDEHIRNRAIPVVILTGDEDTLVHEVSRQVGAAHVLTKPISAEELLHAIQQAIGITFDP